MKKMNIELKNIKHSEFASHETNCYQATIYIDGKRWAMVENDGWGGSDFVHPFEKNPSPTFKEIEANIAEHWPTWNCLGKDTPQDLEMVCSGLLTEWLVKKDIRKDLRKCTTFDPKNKSVSTWGTLKHDKAKVIEWVKKNKPSLIVLNDLPIDKVVDYYKQIAA